MEDEKKPEESKAAEHSGSWKCPSCGTENTGKFCSNCGRPVAGRFCPECGAEVK